MSAITGRAPDNALNYDIRTRRSEREILDIQFQINSDSKIIEDLMYILSSMPRMVLLILKTNDLTRNLDENLQSHLGPERTFMIMANYCARCVYEEDQELIKEKYQPTGFSIMKSVELVKVWWQYQRRISMLYIYDFVLAIRNARKRILRL